MPPGSDGPVVAKDGEVVIRDDNGNVVFLIRKETGDVFVGSSERSGNFFVESADGKHAFRVLSFGPKVDVDIGTKLQPASVTLTGDFLVADSFAERRETGGAILTEHSFRYDRVRGVISLTDKLEAEGEPGTFVELEPGAEPGQSISLAAGKVVQTLLTVDQTGLKIIQGGPDLSTGAEEEASFGGGGIGVPGFAVAGGRVELGKTFEGGAIPGFLRIVGRVFPDEVSSVPTTFVDIDGAERKIEVTV